MKRCLALIVTILALYSIANAQLVTPGGGTGAASSIQFTNTSLPVSSASAASQCLQTNAGNTAVVLGACAGGGAYPAGNVPQIGGFSALNTSEAETVGGDATFTRAGANSYTLTVTKTSGTAFTSAATTAIGTSGATIPLLSTANTWTLAQTFSTAPVMSGASITSNTIPNASLVTQGGVTAGSYTSTNLTVNAQGIITAVSNGAGGGGTPIYTHAMAAGTTGTLTVHGTTAATDVFYEAPTGNFTATTDLAANMGDGQQVIFRVHNAGTANTVTFAAGTGVTLATAVPGDSNSTPGAICVPPATGDTWYRFEWDATLATKTLTLLGCGPQPSAVISVAQGGTGQSTLTANAPLFGNGTTGIISGTRTGNTTQVLTGTGTYTTGDILKVDASGNAIDAGPMALGFDYIGTPTASMVEAYTCAYTLNFPSGLTSPNTQATCGTNPAESDTYTISVNGVSKGTVALSTACSATLTAASSFTCTAGQRLTLAAPATVSGSDIAITLAYTR